MQLSLGASYVAGIVPSDSHKLLLISKIALQDSYTCVL